METKSYPLILANSILVFPGTAVTFPSKKTIFGNIIKKCAISHNIAILSLLRTVEGQKTPHKISLLVKANYLEKTEQIHLQGLDRIQIHHIEQNTLDPYDIMGDVSEFPETKDLFPITDQIVYIRLKQYYKKYVTTKIENPIVKAQLLSKIQSPHFVIHSLGNLLLSNPSTQQKILEAENWTQRMEILWANINLLPSFPDPKKSSKEIKRTVRRDID